MQNESAPLRQSATVTLPAEVTSFAILGRLSSVAAGLADGRVGIWDSRESAASVLLKPHSSRVLAITSTLDGREFWSAAADGSLARTATATGAAPASQRLEFGAAPVRAAAFSSDGSLLVTGNERGEIRVFDTRSGALRHRLQGHRTEMHSIAVRPGAATAASASAEADLRIWDAAAGREIGAIDADLAMFAIAFSPHDGTLASGGVDRRVTLRHPTTFKPVGELVLQAPRMVLSLAWSADGRLVAFGDLDDRTLSKGGIQIMNAESRAIVATLDTGGVPAGALVFTDGGLVATVGRTDLKAWRL